MTCVIDGDTVGVQLESGTADRIRLIGIDTPEVLDPRKPVQCFGREASAHAHELLAANRLPRAGLQPGDRDLFGRLLAYVWLPDGRNFGEVMIGDGFANSFHRGSEVHDELFYDEARGYHRTTARQVVLARERQQLSESKRMLAVCRRTIPKLTALPVLGNPPEKSS